MSDGAKRREYDLAAMSDRMRRVNAAVQEVLAEAAARPEEGSEARRIAARPYHGGEA